MSTLHHALSNISTRHCTVRCLVAFNEGGTLHPIVLGPAPRADIEVSSMLWHLPTNFIVQHPEFPQ